MNLLRLTYTRERDQFQQVSLIGDPLAIRDLHWQLTHNYSAKDGTKIGEIKVYDLEGALVPIDRLYQAPQSAGITLTRLER